MARTKRQIGGSTFRWLMMATVLVLAAQTAVAEYEDGIAAARSGDFSTALIVWQPLAEQGDASAQYSLGAMYLIGQGIQQDYVEAVKWFRLFCRTG